jgi:hypothetical protein
MTDVNTPVRERAQTSSPPNFDQIMAALDESRRILEWDDDWDGEGSPKYEETTWQRAADFLRSNALRLWEEYASSIEAPRVLPGPDGSIDIHWQTGDHELLVNIPADSDELATYYGDTPKGHVIKGKLDTSADNPWLLMWLAK